MLGPAALARPVASRTQAKLDSGLQARAKRGAGAPVLVDVYVRGRVRTVAARLRALGMRVEATTAGPGAFRIVEGRLGPVGLRRAAALSGVRAVSQVPATLLDVGARTSEGVAAHHADVVQAGGVKGAGVNVGIVSDSINQVGSGVAGSQSSSDLPAKVTVLSDHAGGIDEGRAMAEIAYDEAPGIPQILFGTAVGVGPVGKAALIDNMVSHGANVIADDTDIPSEPFFQDGVVAQAVDRAHAAGVAYFAAAGNERRQSWEGTFTPSSTLGPSGHALEDFGGGDPVQTIVDVPNGATLRLFLQWDEPVGGATTDLDLYLRKPDGSPLPGTPPEDGITDNVVGGVPFETAKYDNTTGSTQTVAVEIERSQGTRAPFMKYVAIGDGISTFSVAEHATDSNTIAPDAAAARGAIAVAAINAGDPGLDDVESFSSRGPVTHFFDATGHRLASPEVRAKPEIAAADGVSTTLGPPFDPFFGTSAAAPSAAGVAALLLSAKPALGADGVRAIMTDPRATNDCNPAGEPDTECGFGFPFADSAVQLASDSTPPAVSGHVDPPAPDGANGWYTGSPSVSWSFSDPDSPVFATSGCAGTTVSTDTPGSTLTCTATSAGGAGSASVGLKRDASPPLAPVFSGIAARTYQAALVPPARAVSCSATDPTSGIDPSGCVLSGYSRRLGSHTLVAVARNNAGLTTTGSLVYKVVPTAPAIARLSAPSSVRRAAFLRHGVVARVSVARGHTRLVADLMARLASGGRRVRIAHLSRTLAAGRPALRLRALTGGAAVRSRLRTRSRTVLTLIVTGTPRVGARRMLRRTIVVVR